MRYSSIEQVQGGHTFHPEFAVPSPSHQFGISFLGPEELKMITGKVQVSKKNIHLLMDMD